MSAGDVALCNAALLLLGERPFTAFDDGTDAADTCRLLWQGVCDNLQAVYPWRFNTVQQQLAQLADAPVNWSYAYQLPGDLLNLRDVRTSNQPYATRPPEFDRAEARLLTNEPEIWLTYQIRKDPAVWPAPFALLARYALAAELALPITGKTDLMDAWTRRAFGGPLEHGAGGQYLVAMQQDGAQQTPQVLDTSVLIAARLGSVIP